MTVSFFEAFNARDLQPVRVAESFVPYDKFQALTGPSHSLLIGPRGSGKTTLLKMLSLEAMRAWTHAKADDYRQKLDFTGVFVPADITWKEMVDGLTKRDLPEDCRDALGQAAFCVNVLLALTETMASRLGADASCAAPTYRLVPEPKDIDQVIGDIAQSWRLKITSFSFAAIRRALRQRLDDLYESSNRFQFTYEPAGRTIKGLYEFIPYLSLDVFQCVESAVNAFDDAIGFKNDRWAILFDEFEVVPLSIQRRVLMKLRATSRKIIYKVALAPCGPHTTSALDSFARPSEGDDVVTIELWYRNKADALSFCQDLFLSKMETNPHLRGMSPEKVFGPSSFSEDAPNPGEDNAPLLPGLEGNEVASWVARWLPQFEQLATKDQTFAKFLREKGLNPDNLDSSQIDPSPSAPNGNTIRKIAQLVAFRNTYRAADGKKVGRKPWLIPYTGWDALAAVSEGNPRWLIGMLKSLDSNMINVRTDPIVSRSDQSEVVARAAMTFTEKLKTVATEENTGISTNVPVFELLSRIGEALGDILIKGNFLSDPPMSFEVDSAVAEDIVDSLRIALNFGAIVSDDPRDHVAGFSSVRGKSFRLAYMLAPQFNLPLRSTGRSRKLSSLLFGKHRSTATLTDEQGSLW